LVRKQQRNEFLFASLSWVSFLIATSTFNGIGQAQDPVPEQPEKSQLETAPAAPAASVVKEEAPAAKEGAFAKAKERSCKLLEA